MSKWRGNRMQTLGGRITALLLAVLLCVQLWPATAQAAEGVAPKKDAYAMVTVTGNASPQDIQYLSVVYTDGNGIERQEYIFPALALRETLTAAAGVEHSVSATNARREANAGVMQEMMGITTPGAESRKPFQPYSRDTFFFYPRYELKQIVRVEIFNKDRSSWACQSMEFYRVETLYGLDSVGAVANSVFISFSGTKVAAMDGAATFTGAFNIIGKGGRRSIRTDFSGAEAAIDLRSSEYALAVDMCSSYGAGLQSLAADAVGTPATLRTLAARECLLADVRYKTTGGAVVQVYVPMVADAIGWALEQGVSDSEIIHGIAQEGERLTAGLRLPEFASLERLELTISTQADIAATAGFSAPSEGDTANSSVKISGVSLYDLRLTQANVSVQDSVLTTAFEGMPAYYYTSASAQGTALPYGEATNIGIREYQAGSQLQPTADVETNRFLVVLHTDTAEGSASTSDLSVQLQYMDTDGSEKESNIINVREAVREYYGYWPATVSDLSYRKGMEEGGELRFIVSLRRVSYFTGVTFALGGDDDWQCGGISVYRLDSVGGRTVTWGDVTYNGTVCANRSYDRTYTGELILSSGTKALVQKGASGGDKKTISVISDSVITKEDVNWSDVRYSMSYEMANRDLGFTRARQTYTVVVEVAEDTVSAGADGDCGSKNQFYFQLVFQSGKSAYVLANQQLSADGFRSGTKETFTVSTNQDYGELTEVRIIPDDTAGNEYTYDKLNIASIRVRKNSSGALSRQWVLDNVGWVDINYRDDAAAVSESGQASRSEAELARSYLVSYSSNVVNLMICITTDQFDDTDVITTPFSGELMAQISYYNGAGELCTPESIDVIRAIYEYNNRTANYDKASVTVNADGSTSLKAGSHAVSDPAQMFRQNKADRFILSIDDISALNSITFSGSSQTECRWKIKSVAAALVTGDGDLQLNSNSEYVRTGEIQPLCTHTSANTPAYLHDFLPGETSEFTVYFSDNSIEPPKDESSWVSAVTRKPLSQNDSLNIYVYPTDTANMGSYELSAAVQYSSDYGVTYQSAVKKMSRTADGFYALGVGATGMSALRSLTLKADDTTVQAQISYAVVQQVRSGVTIASYRIEYNDFNAAVKITNGPTSGKTVETGEEQVIYLQLGSATQTADLFAEKRDVAVSLRYTTTNGFGTASYSSANVFLTDQQISSIAAGDVICLRFSEPYIREITGLTVSSVGGLSVEVESACVLRYDANGSCLSCGFANGVTVQSSTATMLPTNSGSGDRGNVALVTMQFTTAEDTESAKTTLTGALPVQVTYRDASNINVTTVKIADLRDYISSGSFAAGKTAVVEMLLVDAHEITGLTLTPAGGWYLDEISTSVLGGRSNSCAVDRLLPSGKETNIDLTAVTLTLTAVQTVDGVEQTYRVSPAVPLTVQPGESITLTPAVQGSRSRKFTAVLDRDETALAVTESAIVFTAPTVTESMTYTLTVTPEANAAAAAVFRIVVEPKAAQEQP